MCYFEEMERRKIGFVTGLQAEARLLRNKGFLVAAGGGHPEGAYQAAEGLLAQGAEALVSFGLAGGLARHIKAGDLLVPPAVIEGPRTYPCDYRLMEFLGGSTGKPMLANHKIVATVREKAMLFGRTLADAVDLESGAVSRLAAERGVPFAVLRAVADPAARNLPPAAVHGLRPDGSINLPRILLSLLMAPTQIAGLMRVGRDAQRARSALIKRLRGLGGK